MPLAVVASDNDWHCNPANLFKSTLPPFKGVGPNVTLSDMHIKDNYEFESNFSMDFEDYNPFRNSKLPKSWPARGSPYILSVWDTEQFIN